MADIADSKYTQNKYVSSFGSDVIKERLFARYGQRYLAYREKWLEGEGRSELEFPLNIMFDLVDACTLSCQQCIRAEDVIGEYEGYIGSGRRMELEIVDKVLEECRLHSVPSVNIGGTGECMLHPDFVEICSRIMGSDVMELRLATNAMLLGESIAESLVDLQVHVISVSIDALTESTYAKVRGKGKVLEQVKENISGFMKVRQEKGSLFPILRVTFVKQPANIHEARGFLDYWSEHAEVVDFQTYSDYRASGYSSDFFCYEPWMKLSVWADGHVGPCCGLPGIKYNLGDIRDMSLEQIWKGEKIRTLRKQLADGDHPAYCLKCLGALVEF